MAELKIPNLNKRSDKYIFKRKLTLRRKSRRRLITETVLMIILSFLLIYINNLIPNKNLLFQNLPNTLNKTLLVINFFLPSLCNFELDVFFSK